MNKFNMSDFNMIIYNKGSYYKGHWERGIRNGEGELYIPGSNIQKGLFNNNAFV